MTLQHLVVPIEWKAADDEDDNILVGYASTFGNVDLGGDVVVKGAFAKSVETINAKGGGIPLLADHVASTASVLGTIYEAREDDKGLVIKARISKAPSAQDTAVKLREGHLSKMSIGYETMDEAFEDKDGQRVRLLKEVKLWETSVVVFPMNPKADIAYVKSIVDGVFDAIPEAERKGLLQRLVDAEHLTDAEKSVTIPTEQSSDSTRAASSEPEAQAAPEAPVAKDDGTPDAGGEPASAPGEGASVYDRFASRAVLAGRDNSPIDPVTRASLEQRLRLAEGQLPDTDPE